MNELGVVGFGHVGTYIKNMEVSNGFIWAFSVLKFSMNVITNTAGTASVFENKDCVVELVQFKIGKTAATVFFDHLTIEVEDIGKAKEYLEGRELFLKVKFNWIHSSVKTARIT